MPTETIWRIQGFLSYGGIGGYGWVSFNFFYIFFYIFLCTSNSISKGTWDMCYRKDINIGYSCFSQNSYYIYIYNMKHVSTQNIVECSYTKGREFKNLRI